MTTTVTAASVTSIGPPCLVLVGLALRLVRWHLAISNLQINFKFIVRIILSWYIVKTKVSRKCSQKSVSKCTNKWDLKFIDSLLSVSWSEKVRLWWSIISGRWISIFIRSISCFEHYKKRVKYGKKNILILLLLFV